MEQHKSAVVDQVEVEVARTNGHGFQDTTGAWHNFSKFANPQPPMPTPGQRVLIGIDKSGFVRTVEAVPSPKLPPDANNTVKLGGVSSETTSDTSTPSPAQMGELHSNAKDAQIARMNALGHAVALVTHNAGISHATVRLDDVLACARRLEEWITGAA